MNSRLLLRRTALLKRPLSRATEVIERHGAAFKTIPRGLIISPISHWPDVSHNHGHSHRSFSSSTLDDNKAFDTAMRNMVKPFFMKCHPDLHTDSAKEVNLEAIQNLNAFLDSMAAQLKPAAKLKKNEKTIFEVDFCVKMEERLKGKMEEIICRRKVELAIPTRFMGDPKQRRNYQKEVENQLVKLLYIAGVRSEDKAGGYDEPTDLEAKIRRDWQKAIDTGDTSHLNEEEIARARKEKYERSREEFVSRFNYKKFKKVYQQTLKDLEAGSITDGLIRDDPKRRMAYLAQILSRVRVDEGKEVEEGDVGEVDPISQLISLRRLALILDENFDDLSLEELGSMWDSTTIVLTAPRNYNTSPSALYRRRKRKSAGDVMANDGFAFALHHDNSVTIQIPVDFRDEELITQLKRHVQDFHDLIELDMDSEFALFMD